MHAQYLKSFAYKRMEFIIIFYVTLKVNKIIIRTHKIHLSSQTGREKFDGKYVAAYFEPNLFSRERCTLTKVKPGLYRENMKIKAVFRNFNLVAINNFFHSICR
jgi:hypothetical protein